MNDKEFIRICNKHQIQGLSQDLEIFINKAFFDRCRNYAEINNLNWADIKTFKNIVAANIWAYFEVIPYEERLICIKSSSILPIEVQNDIINMYRQAYYEYGLRIRKRESYYLCYWDKTHFNEQDVADLEILFNNSTSFNQNMEKIKRLLR